MQNQIHVGIIGAGYAGLAAAVTLAQREIPVTVLEASKYLGGRARRVDHRDLALDNGLHILLGCYSETLRLIDLVAAPENSRATCFLRLPLQLVINGHFSLKAPRLPAPLNLAAGLLKSRGASLKQRVGAAKFMLELRRRRFSLEHDMSVADLLKQYSQGDDIVRFLWQPLCISALNTPPEIASARVFLQVLRDSMSGSRADSDLLLPRVDLSRLFPDRAAEYIGKHSGKVLPFRTVNTVYRSNHGFSVYVARQRFDFSHVICAVPPHRLAPLVANLPELKDAAKQVNGFEYQPIYSIYFQYPQPVRLPLPMVGLHGGHAQWVFDRDRLCRQPGVIAAVISAQGLHQELTHDDLASNVRDELRRSFGFSSEPAWHRVIAEKRATFSCNVDLKRPAQVTPLKNFFLAGDYTESDYPATIEAAVRSGIKCATHILQNR